MSEREQYTHETSYAYRELTYKEGFADRCQSPAGVGIGEKVVPLP